MFGMTYSLAARCKLLSKTFWPNGEITDRIEIWMGFITNMLWNDKFLILVWVFECSEYASLANVQFAMDIIQELNGLMHNLAHGRLFFKWDRNLESLSNIRYIYLYENMRIISSQIGGINWLHSFYFDWKILRITIGNVKLSSCPKSIFSYIIFKLLVLYRFEI